MDTVDKRLKYIIKSMNINQKELAELVGLSVPFMSLLFNNKRTLSTKLGISIANATGFNINWLLHGNGKPKKEQEESNMENVINPEIQELINNLVNDNSLSELQTAKLTRYAKRLLKKYPYHPNARWILTSIVEDFLLT